MDRLSQGEERLLLRPQLLDTAARLALVVAPAGFGKSSLLRQWAGGQDTLWVEFASRPEGTPQVLGALQRVLGVEAPTLEGLLPFLTGKRLVLDDLQFCSDEQDRKDLELLVEGSEAFSLALGSRTEPNLSALHRRRVRQQLTEVSALQLGFQGADLARWMAQLLPSPLTPESLALLEAKTQGWAAVLVLVAQRLLLLPAEQWPAAIARLSGHSQALYDYLAAELLDSLPENLRRFLLELSLLPHVESSPENRLFLRELERRRLLLPSPRGFTLHALLVEFLQARLEEERGPDAFRALCDSKAKQLWEQGDWEAAFRLWWGQNLLAPLCQAIDQTHHVRPLDYFPWVKLLPLDLLDAAPRVLLLRASAELETQGSQVEALLDRAEGRLADDPEGWAEARLLRARFYRYQDREERLHLLSELEQVLTAPSPGRVRLLQEWAFYHYAHGELALAGRAMDEAMALLQQVGGTPVQQASVLVQRATMIDLWQGRFDRVREAHQQLITLFAPSPPAVILAFLSVLETELAVHLLDPELDTIAQRFWERTQAAGYVTMGRQARLFQAFAAARGGELGRARAFFEQALVSAQEYLYLNTLLPLYWSTESEVRAPALQYPASSLWWQFAEPLFARGKRRDALRLLDGAYTVAEALGNPYALFQACYWSALLQPTSPRLEECLTLAQQQGYDDILLRLPHVSHFLSFALARGIQTERVCALLDAQGRNTLVIQSFGELCLRDRNGAIAWFRPKARALFAYLWLAEGKPVMVERLVAALWPEADEEKGRQSYRTHATYLRRALGESCLETSAERVRLVLPEARFEDRRVLLQAHASDEPSLWEQALSVVGEGEFLPEFAYEDWAQQERQRLPRLRQELRLRFAQHCLRLHQPERALELARLVLREDPLEEDAALLAFSSLIALERLSEARQLWQRVRLAHEEAQLPLTPNAQAALRKLGLWGT